MSDVTGFQRRRRKLAKAAAEAQQATMAEGEQKSIDRMNKAELVALATTLGLETEGTNAELRDRIRAVLDAGDGGEEDGGQPG